MTDIMLFLLVVATAANGLIRLYTYRHRFDLERTALSIYGIIIENYGSDNVTSEVARQQARMWFAKISHEWGFPLSAQKDVERRVVAMTREKVKRASFDDSLFTIQNNL